ncbi:hypothetical protein MLD38_014514 [Melastoma candidum]|uniref:Uncharacterized protein n=1 Tax=Melastoma candidum TaxID=119954 RepID=A0ACB9REX3_9MYRT|nr:hypothetical protein MLD38_014514 [Melastoma candidum]
MRAGLSTIQQTLTADAATVLNHSIAEAGRRNHSQTNHPPRGLNPLGLGPPDSSGKHASSHTRFVAPPCSVVPSSFASPWRSSGSPTAPSSAAASPSRRFPMPDGPP